MKYIRKFTVVILALILIVAVVIGTCVIFSVRNVNVTFIGYGDDSVSGNVEEIKASVLECYRGSLISHIDEDGVKECLDDSYVLTGFEKIYPCTVNLTVKARRETFAVADGGFYDIYDADGVFLCRSESFINSSDNSPDVILTGTETLDDVKSAAKVCALFSEEFSSLRSAVETAGISKAVSTVDTDKFVFVLRCGLTVEIADYKALTREKIAGAAEVFAALTGEQKLCGAIYCYVTNDGSVRATYNKNA